MKERDVSYDLMRVVGILCIMIDHAEPPGWLFQLRNFGTPLLIVTSALTYSTIYSRKKMEAGPFLKRRLSRLIFPAWIFLGLFFSVYFLISTLLEFHYPFKAYNIISAFTFYSGFRFMWIFKVYVILALITPISLIYKNKVTSGFIYFSILLLLYFVYELVVYFSKPIIPANSKEFIDSVIFVILPYTLLFMYGLKMGELSTKTMIYIAIISTAIFTAFAIYQYKLNGYFVITSRFKFPPTIYYLSYAFAAIHVIYPICKYLAGIFNTNFIMWLSSKSLWIYLWHIVAYYIWLTLFGKPDGDFYKFLPSTIFLFGFGILATYLQSLLVNKYLMNSKNAIVSKLAFYLS